MIARVCLTVDNDNATNTYAVFAYPFHFGESGFSAYFSRQIRISGFYCAGPHRPLYTVKQF